MADEENNTTSTEENNIFIFKGRFKSNNLNLYGLFLIIYNKSVVVESHNIVVSTFSNIFDLEPHVSWEQYEEKILDIKWKGNFNNSMTSSLMDQLKRFSNEETLKNQLYDSLCNYSYDSVDKIIFDNINRIIHDNNLILETGIQEVTPEEFQKTKAERFKVDKPPVQADSGYSFEEGSAILIVEPILAPVKGKPIYELRIGDKIMTKISPNTDRANYFIDLMNLRIENLIKPVPCEVVDIKSEGKDEPIEILTQIGPGIYGKCIEEERQVKLKIYNPSTDGPLAKEGLGSKQITKDIGKKKLTVEETGFSKTTYAMFALFFLILIIFILLIYISF